MMQFGYNFDASVFYNVRTGQSQVYERPIHFYTQGELYNEHQKVHSK